MPYLCIQKVKPIKALLIMAKYTLTNIWSCNEYVSGRCIGVYPTKEKAQEAMKKAVENIKLAWVNSRNLIPKVEFNAVEGSRISLITSLVDTDWEKFVINEIEIDD